MSFDRKVVDIKLSTGEEFECDYNISNLVVALNRAGLKTTFSCEGHIEEDMCAGVYVAIDMSDFFTDASPEEQSKLLRQLKDIVRNSALNFNIHDYLFEIIGNIVIIDNDTKQVVAETTICHEVDVTQPLNIDRMYCKIRDKFISIFDHIENKKVITDTKVCIRSTKLSEVENSIIRSHPLLTPSFNTLSVLKYRNNWVNILTELVINASDKLKNTCLKDYLRSCDVESISEVRTVVEIVAEPDDEVYD